MFGVRKDTNSVPMWTWFQYSPRMSRVPPLQPATTAGPSGTRIISELTRVVEVPSTISPRRTRDCG